MWIPRFTSRSCIVRDSLPAMACWNNGRVLGPAPPGSLSWDSKAFAGAVVVPTDPSFRHLRMYYYGRCSDMWNMGVTPFNPGLPTGRIGMALSTDGGLSFERVAGPLDGGAVLDPSNDPDAFDCVHVAVGDVLFHAVHRNWHLYYFGGSLDELPLPGKAETRCRGLRLQPGLAISDNGIDFDNREGPILKVGDPGSWDEHGVSWPRVLQPAHNGDPWIMSYHTREGGGPMGTGFFSAGIAASMDGRVWEKKGKVLSCGESGTWDEGGVSVRHIVHHNGKYLMFYGGSNFKFEFAIGLAVSDDGFMWKKDTQSGPEPGGPVLRARAGEDVWDNVAVGTPYVIAMPNGGFQMYYLGFGRREGQAALQQGIGLALSDGSDFRWWSRLSN